MLKGFKQFIIRGNAIDLAVGVVVGAAFGSVVNSLVKDILTPFISGLFSSPDFSGFFFNINGSKILYGSFLNSLFSFFLVTASIYFFVITPINTLVSRTRKEKPLDETTKKCPECLSEIPVGAKRCAFCAQSV